MEEIRRRFTRAVAERLSAAPPSTAKDEVVEELSDNLYHRFLDMTAAGMGDEEAFQRSMEDLGDVDELLSYLGAQADRPQGGRESRPGDAQSDLDAIFAAMAEACRTAVDQTRDAVVKAKEAIQRRTTVEKSDGRVKVHFNTHLDRGTSDSPPSSASSGPDAPPAGCGWEFEAEMDPDQGRFFAGGGPKQKQNVVYGFGYDKDRGGFFAQWGEYRAEGQTARGPHFSGEEGAYMAHNEDDSYSVTALKDLRGLNIQTVAGDVSIHISEAPDAGVIIDGDVDDLDVTCSADGVLTIREGRTASSSFFSRRGFRCADVELFLPRRHWEAIAVTTASGDVDVDRDGLDVGRLSVKTASGDLNVRLRSCGQLSFHSASGDLDLQGACADLQVQTASGDISLQGQVEDARLNTASGDIGLDGLVRRFSGSTMSGDVSVVTPQLPELMEMSSKSGDCEARLPDAGPFTLRYKTVSGDVDFAFPFQFSGGAAIYGDGSGPAYSMTTVSGGIALDRY